MEDEGDIVAKTLSLLLSEAAEAEAESAEQELQAFLSTFHENVDTDAMGSPVTTRVRGAAAAAWFPALLVPSTSSW